MDNGAVTLLDVLGWKGIWQREKDGIDRLTKLIELAKNKGTTIVGAKTVSGRNDNPFKDLEFELISISDTIALVTFGDCDKSLEFHGGLCSRIIKESILEGIPVRGATSYGQLSIKNNILIGPAIDEVAAWYEAANWIGAIHTPSALFQTQSNYSYGDYYLIEHDVSIKNFGSYSTVCANWPRMWINEEGNDDKKLKEQFVKMGPITQDIAPKFLNSLEFFNKVKRNNGD